MGNMQDGHFNKTLYCHKFCNQVFGYHIAIYNSAVFGWFACIQHFAGIPGGRVDGPDLAPGGVGVQPIDGILNPD